MSERNGQGGDLKRAIAAVVGIMSVGLVVAAARAKQRSRKDEGAHDPGNEARVEGGTGDFELPADMQAVIPEPPSYAPA